MGLCSCGCDCESAPTRKICHHCIRVAYGRCWTLRAPRALQGQPVGQAEWLALAAPQWSSGARHTTAKAAADLWRCLQTNSRRCGCKQQEAAPGRDVGCFITPFLTSHISRSHLLYSMLHHIFESCHIAITKKKCYILVACHMRGHIMRGLI